MRVWINGGLLADPDAPAEVRTGGSSGVSKLILSGTRLYYTAQGLNLDTICTIVDVGGVGVIQPGTYDLAGNAEGG